MGDESYSLSVERVGERAEVSLRGRLGLDQAGPLLTELREVLRAPVDEVALDLSGVDYLDSSGAGALLLIGWSLEQRGARLRVASSTPEIDRMLDLVRATEVAPRPRARPRPTVRSRLLPTARQHLRGAREVLVFTGEIGLGLVDVAVHPWRLRWRQTLVELQRAGADSFPIVALISFLVGTITAFQALVQLRQFGADIYVANLVGLSMVRELGPLMTAVIASGRSGAAYAAEIGTMKVSEEIDALVTLGFDRTRFLITPKVLALVLMLPCLVIFSDAIGILGGMIVSSAWIDMTPDTYLRQTQLAVRTTDFASGLVKAVAFGLLVAIVGCLRGLQARGGAESVGQVTTSAVVTSLTLIIATDAVFTLIFNYWGI